MKKFLIIFAVVAVVLGGLAIYIGVKVVSGLQQKAGDIVASKILSTATQGKVKVDSNGKDVTINGVTVKQGLPDNFPKDFPMVPNAEVTGSMGKGNTSTTTVSVQAPLQEVYDFYVKNLADKGWQVKETTLGELKMFDLKKDNLTGNLTLTSEDSKTNMLINFKAD